MKNHVHKFNDKCEHDQEYAYYSFSSMMGQLCECCGIASSWTKLVQKANNGKYYCEVCFPNDSRMLI